jgi:hypothetical protein
LTERGKKFIKNDSDGS